MLGNSSFPTHPHLNLSKILAACCRLSHVLYVARYHLQAENPDFRKSFFLPFGGPFPAVSGVSGRPDPDLLTAGPRSAREPVETTGIEPATSSLQS